MTVECCSLADFKPKVSQGVEALRERYNCSSNYIAKCVEEIWKVKVGKYLYFFDGGTICLWTKNLDTIMKIALMNIDDAVWYNISDGFSLKIKFLLIFVC